MVSVCFATKVASDPRPYSETVFEGSPLNRPLKDYGPGQDWYDNGRFVEHRYLANVHGTGVGQEKVVAWDINGPGNPVRMDGVDGYIEQAGYYSSGQLYVNSIIDEHGKEVREYTNKQGQVILKKVQLKEENPDLNNHEDWAQTSYIYDDFGNLRFVLQPELVKKALQDDSYVPTQADLDHFAFQHRYDHRNRLVEKRVPGAGWLYMVYDDRDRLVLTQDGNQRGEGVWAFTKYDALNRPVSTGVYPHTATTQQAMQAVLDAFYAGAPANSYYEERGGPVHGYTNRSFPQVGDGNAYHAVTYYDDYGFKVLIGGTAYDFKGDELAGQEIEENPRVKGLVTGTKTRVLGTDKFLWGVTYYDDKYRPVQTVTENYPEGLDRVTNLYNFPGWLMETRLSHQGEETVTVHMEHTYDHAGRLLETHHTINNGDPVLLAANEYNELGELVKKHLHKQSGNAFAQSVDYRYNIRGWLKRINNSDLSPDAGDDRGDLFGMELYYNDGFEIPQYNGNISGTRWKNAVDGKERAYGYTYDAANRLTGADYVAGGTGGWEHEENRFEVGNIGYDHNGNILTLDRNGVFRQLPMEAAEYGATDQLSYYYKGNQLMAVNDAMDTPEGNKSDFRDNGSKGSLQNPEYAYDANGNMTWDGNKGITVGYNHLNLPKKVDFGNNKYIEYTYDATGTKLRQEVHDGQNPVKRTDYVGAMVYRDGQLQFVQHGEGRIVMVDNDGLSKLPEYQYHLKDHLGNVRLTYSADPETESNTATLETAHEDGERAKFLRYDGTTKINSTLFDHTGNGDTHYAIRLNGSENERIGLAQSLAVMTGDIIRAEVYAKYLDPDQNNWTAALQNLMAAIAGGTAPMGTVIEAVPPSGGDGFPFTGLLDGAKAGDTGPKAYLSILVFDEGSQDPVDIAYVPITVAAKENGTYVPHERLALEIVVQQPGYAYIYLSNDSDQPLEVFFDDFTVEHVHSAIVQADDYYPFGMEIASLSHRRENAFLNNYRYQGDFSEKSDMTGWNSFYLRNYDSQIGRWTSVDPYDQYPSPYMGMGNDPINTIDPDGGFGIGAMAQIALGAYSAYRAYDQGGIHAVGQSLMMGFLSGLGGGYNPASMGEGIAHGVVSGLINNAGTGGGGWDAVASIGVGAFGGGVEGSTNATAFRKTQASLLEDFHFENSLRGGIFGGILPEVTIQEARSRFVFSTWYGNTNRFLNPVVNAVLSARAAVAPYVMAIIPMPGIPGLGGTMGKGLGKIGGRALGRFAAKASTTITRSVGAAPKGFSNFKSINQLNKLVQTGKLPKTITRFDKGKILGELDHVHFSNGAALNINGTWKHGFKVLTNKEIKILSQNGWIIPK